MLKQQYDDASDKRHPPRHSKRLADRLPILRRKQDRMIMKRTAAHTAHTSRSFARAESEKPITETIAKRQADSANGRFLKICICALLSLFAPHRAAQNCIFSKKSSSKSLKKRKNNHYDKILLDKSTSIVYNRRDRAETSRHLKICLLEESHHV